MKTLTRTVTAVLAGAAMFSAALLAPAAPATADSWRKDQYWLDDYGFTQAWKTNRGEGVKVAVIDTGIDDSHPDLIKAVAGGFDASGQGNSTGTQPLGEDPDHGTMVASLLAGHGNNASAIKRAKKKAKDDDKVKVPKPGPGKNGVIGTAPDADLLSVSVSIGDESGIPTDDQIASGVIWAVDEGADVINISLASDGADWPTSWDEAFAYAEEHDVVVVAAAGNRASGSEMVGAPATIPGVLTVAGLDQDGNASWDASTEGITIGVSAPSEPLVGATPGGDYVHWDGTSGAAPLVAGLAALIRAEYPDATAPEVINHILNTADDAGERNLYGYGTINAEAALATEPAAVDANPMGSIAEWIRIHRRGEVDEQSKRTHEGHAAVDVPTDLPQAAKAQPHSTGWETAILIGGGALVLIAVSGLICSYSRRNK